MTLTELIDQLEEILERCEGDPEVYLQDSIENAKLDHVVYQEETDSFYEAVVLHA